MTSLSVKMSLAALVVAGGSGFALSPATALPVQGRSLAAGETHMIQMTWCGPYGCGGGWGGGWGGYGGYGWRPQPRPWGGGYGWRPRPYGYGFRPRPWGGGYGWGGGWGPRW